MKIPLQKTMGLVAGVLLLSVFSTAHAQQVTSSAGTGLQNKNADANHDRSLNALVRDIINHEMEAQAHDSSLWCFRKVQEKDGKPQQLFSSCQTKTGEIDRLLAVNGKTLDEQQQKAEDQRIAKLLKSPYQLKKQAQQQHEDGKQATNLLKVIPDAFLFSSQAKEGDRVRVKFVPNPKFRPSSHEAQVFHHMQGTLLLDTKQKRLVEIKGQLDSAVKFGGGLLGHLDKGGTFLVKQQEVASGIWEVATLDVRMNGKALFFKTIAVREKEIDTDFRAVPQTTSIQQAAAMTQGSSELTASK